MKKFMAELIILGLITFFIIKKLNSTLGEESDEEYFGYDSILQKNKIKDAEQINAKDDDDNYKEEKYDDLTEEAKTNIDIIKRKINNFSISKFEKIASKVLEQVFDANNKQDKDEIKKFLSQELSEAVCKTYNEENIVHIYVISFNEIKTLDVTKNNDIFKIKIMFDMRQINYTTNKNDDIIEGDKNNIIAVKEIWTFAHDFSKKNNNIWIVDDIEEQ